MNKLLLGSFAVAMTMGGSAAMAADMPLKAPPPPVLFSWTGCYVGIQGGGAWGRSRHDFGPAPTFANGAGPFVAQYTPWFNISGGLAGVEYGCNQQFGGNWVFGLESDISWSGKKGSSNETGPFGVALGTTAWSDETREKWISTSRMRFGYTWDRVWLYVTGGFAAARVDANINVPVAVGAVPIGTYSDHHTLYGWTAGAGFEWAFLTNWSLKAEYLYVRFENQAYQFFGTPLNPAGALGGGNAFLPRNGGLNVDNHIARLGLNWRFTDCVFGTCPAVAPAPIYTK